MTGLQPIHAVLTEYRLPRSMIYALPDEDETLQICTLIAIEGHDL